MTRFPSFPSFPSFGRNFPSFGGAGLRQLPELTPEEEESLLKKYAGMGLSGLATVGRVLDVPGSIVRGALAGEPGRALGGIFNPSERVYGRELLQKWDLAGPNKPGFDWGDVAGLATDIALDPLLYLTLGGSALGLGGRAAKAAGVLKKAPWAVGAKRLGMLDNPLQAIPQLLGPAAKQMPGKATTRIEGTLDDVLRFTAAENPQAGLRAEQAAADWAAKHGTTLDAIRKQPLGGLAGFGLPFRDPWFAFGTGPAARAFATGTGAVGKAIRKSLPGRTLTQLFRAGTYVPGKPIASAEAQQLAQLGRTRQAVGRAEARSTSSQVMQLLDKSRQAGYDVDNLIEMRQVFENLKTAPPEVAKAARLMWSGFDEGLAAYETRGIPLSDLDFTDPNIRYWTRYLTQTVEGTGGKLSVLDPSTLSRKPILKNIDGGTAALMGFFSDPAIVSAKAAGLGKQQMRSAVAQVAPKYGIPDEFYARTGTLGKGRYAGLAKMIRTKLSLEQLKVGVYGNHPIVDASIRLQTLKELPYVVDTIFDGLAAHSVVGPAEQGMTTVAKVLSNIRTGNRSLQVTDGMGGPGAALQQVADRLGLPAKEVGQRVISRQLADEIVRYHRAYKTGEAAAAIIPFVDGFSNIWKIGVTTIAPAFHVRNLGSGLFRSWIDGTFSTKDAWNSVRMLRGGLVPDAHTFPAIARILNERKLSATVENGNQILRELAYSYGVTGRYMGEALTRVGGTRGAPGAQVAPGRFGEMYRTIPGAVGVKPLGDPLRALRGGTAESTWNPLQATVRGLAGSPESTFAAIKAGEEVGFAVESINRLTPFINLLRKGTEGNEAAMRVALAQVDYSSKAFTPFEREVLRRLFPFYSFTSKNAAYTVRQLWEHPGGRMAQTIRVLGAMRSPDVALPPHIAKTTAIPVPEGTPLIGPQPGGDPRFVTGLGLMLEDPMEFATKGGGVELLSRLNPLVKAPLELITGESFFQRGPLGGRELTQMDPTFGRLVANVTGREDPVRFPIWMEQLLANQPLSRVLSTARTLTDPRKAARPGGYMPGAAAIANVTTGLRITDVSPNIQEQMVKEIVGSIMKQTPGARSFQQFYLPKEVLERMEPAEREGAEELKQVQAILDRYARERAKKKAKLSPFPLMP